MFYSGTLWNVDVKTVYLGVSEMMLLDASECDVLAARLTHDVDVEAAQVGSHVPHFVVALIAHVTREHLEEH